MLVLHQFQRNGRVVRVIALLRAPYEELSLLLDFLTIIFQWNFIDRWVNTRYFGKPVPLKENQMKKLSLSILLGVMVGFALCAQAPVPLSSSSLPFQVSDAATAVTIADSSGAQWLVMASGGQLLASRSDNSESGFSPASIETHGESFDQIRNLVAYDRFGSEWVIFFIARANGKDSLRCVRFDTNNNLILDSSRFDPVDGNEIEHFEVHPDRDRGFYLVLTKNKRLFARFIDRYDTPRSPEPLSPANVTIEQFSFLEHFSNNNLTHYGAYVARSEQQIVLHYFECAPDLVTDDISLPLNTTFSQLSYQVVKDDTGNTWLSVVHDGWLTLYTRKQNVFIPVDGGSGIGQKQVTQFDLIARGTGISLTYTRTNATGMDIYALSAGIVDNTVKLKADNEGKPLNVNPVEGKYQITTLEPNKQFLSYVERQETRQRLVIWRTPDMPQGTSNAAVWCTSTYQGELWDQILDFGIYRHTLADPVVFTRTRMGTEHSVRLTSLPATAMNRPVQVLNQTIASDAVAPSCVWLSNDTALIHQGVEIYWCSGITRPASLGTSGVVAGERALVYTGTNDVYHLPPLRPAPAGALWTCGDPLGQDNAFVRLYLWDNKQPNSLTFEIQKRGLMVEGLWENEALSNTDEYMRYLHFAAGNKQAVSVAVWDGQRRLSSVRLNLGASQVVRPLLGTEAVTPQSKAMLPFRKSASLIAGAPVASQLGASNGQPVQSNGNVFVEHEISDLPGGGFGDFKINNNSCAVFQQYNGHDYDVFLWSEKDGIRNLSAMIPDNNWTEYYPDINDKNEVVWMTYRNLKMAIYIWNGSVVELITPDGGGVSDLQINNQGIVVWNDRWAKNVYMYDSRSVNKICHPIIHRDIVIDNLQLNNNSHVAWHEEQRTGDNLISSLYFWKNDNIKYIDSLNNIGGSRGLFSLNDSDAIAYIGFGQGNTALIKRWDDEGTIIPITDSASYGSVLRLNNHGTVAWYEIHYIDSGYHFDAYLFNNGIKYEIGQIPGGGFISNNHAMVLNDLDSFVYNGRYDTSIFGGYGTVLFNGGNRISLPNFTNLCINNQGVVFGTIYGRHGGYNELFYCKTDTFAPSISCKQSSNGLSIINGEWKKK